MNLHQVVRGVIQAVNPTLQVTLRRSIGSVTNPDFSVTPGYATPGAITASIAGTVLTVSALTAGAIQSMQTLADTTGDILVGTQVLSQISGAPGGAGTYNVSGPAQTVDSEAMTTLLTIPADVQPMSSDDLRQVEALNISGVHKVMYVNGPAASLVRVNSKGGDLVTLPDGSVWLVTMIPEGWNVSAGWTKALITLQDGN